ncbi:uracil phosphoribosyltransferase [Candidatus Terasakiella magnetica]|uniref:Uracil phosphoribosyltransferase n=1 Tax=Candidatus Terasakiella magnetica TaxID=1867952 RepID=A0A1C3REN8_9PROT|nr:uracil phosphoribosyltransferase [Candidatus Terasakiella magnetica]SCA55766.1 uracil phosphoribosyltransferase [Candidatus Terasakiella magnetica]
MFKHPDFRNLYVVDHPLIQHKLSHMRNKETSTKSFRALLNEISLLMGYEITHDLPLTSKEIETPITTIVDAPVLEGRKIAVVPILRAGQGMSDGLLELMPSARVGHVGLYRDEETKKPVEYLVKLPEVEGRTFIVCDPMLATGHSAAYACDVLNKAGVKDEDIRMLVLVGAPEGMKLFGETHPDVKVYVASLDSHLNEKAYIVPGLGDAGDRLFGTK